MQNLGHLPFVEPLGPAGSGQDPPGPSAGPTPAPRRSRHRSPDQAARSRASIANHFGRLRRWRRDRSSGGPSTTGPRGGRPSSGRPAPSGRIGGATQSHTGQASGPRMNSGRGGPVAVDHHVPPGGQREEPDLVRTSGELLRTVGDNVELGGGRDVSGGVKVGITGPPWPDLPSVRALAPEPSGPKAPGAGPTASSASRAKQDRPRSLVVSAGTLR